MDEADDVIDNLPAGAGFAGDGRESDRDDESTDSGESTDSDEPASSVLDETTLPLVKRNDPHFICASFSGGDSESVDWKKNARFIAKNSHLKHMSIDNYTEEGGDQRSTDNFAAFCEGVGANTSLVTFSISECNLNGSATATALANLSPLFESDNLKRIDITGCFMRPECHLRDLDWANVDQLVSLLKNCHSVYHVELDDNGSFCLSSRLVGAFEGRASIKRIHFSSDELPTDGGWAWEHTLQLGTLLQNPKCAVAEMELQLNLDKTCISFMATSLAKNKSLRLLSLSGTLDRDAWCAFATHLQRRRFFLLQDLDLSDNNIDDEALAILGSAAVSSTALESLMLRNNESVGQEAWGSFLGTMCIASSLRELDVSHNAIGDAYVTELADGLATNTSLQILCLLGTGLGDEGAAALKKGLMTNNTLVILDISSNEDIGSHSEEEFRTLLCNPLSIEHTYASNHTLQDLGGIFPGLGSLLRWNRNNRGELPTREDISRITASSKREVAREKILMTHLVDGSYFVDLPPQQGH